jgi:hypothetical protein
MEYLLDELKRINPDALHVVQKLLQARLKKGVTNQDNIELRSDVQRVYSILSKIIDQVQSEPDDNEVTRIHRLIVE